jgi:MFS family permease
VSDVVIVPALGTGLLPRRVQYGARTAVQRAGAISPEGAHMAETVQRTPLAPDPPPVRRVGWGFIALFAAAYLGTSLMLIAPLLVTLALKVHALVGAGQEARSLALVTGVGALLAMVANPLFGRLSDRTTSPHGMRRPWMVVGLAGGCTGIVVVATAPSLGVLFLGWCLAQLFFNALLAVLVAVLPDQIPAGQRGLVSGVLGVCLPLASVSGTFLVQLFSSSQLAMFLAPCALGAVPVLLFALTLDDRRLPAGQRPPWSLRELAGTFYVSPRRNPDFAWVFASRFLFVMAYAFLTTYQVYFLLSRIGSTTAEVPQQVFLGTLAQSVVLVAASLVAGRLSDRTGRRKIFVVTASVVYGLAMFVVAVVSSFDGFLVGVAISGLGFGTYMAVDLALVADVLPGDAHAKDLGVLNIANALPFSVAPALAPAVLVLGGGSYGLLYAVAGVCAVLGAGAILPVKRVR